MAYQYCNTNYLLCFKNEKGIRTLDSFTAQRWISDGQEVVAFTCQKPTDEPQVTSPIKQIGSSDDFKYVCLTINKEKVNVRKKFPRVRYITPDYFLSQDGETEIKVKALQELHKQILAGKKFTAIFHEDKVTKVTTANIVEVDMNERSFKTSTDIKYFCQ